MEKAKPQQIALISFFGAQPAREFRVALTKQLSGYQFLDVLSGSPLRQYEKYGKPLAHHMAGTMEHQRLIGAFRSSTPHAALIRPEVRLDAMTEQAFRLLRLTDRTISDLFIDTPRKVCEKNIARLPSDHQTLALESLEHYNDYTEKLTHLAAGVIHADNDSPDQLAKRIAALFISSV